MDSKAPSNAAAYSNGKPHSRVTHHGDAAHDRLFAIALIADVKRIANRYLGAGRVVLSIVPLGKGDQAAKAAKSIRVNVAPDGSHYILADKH